MQAEINLRVEMPIHAKSLVRYQTEVHSILLNDSLSKAEELMYRYKVKQIPIINEDNKPFGLITSATLSALKDDYKALFPGLTGKDAAGSKALIFSADKDIFDLLNELKEFSALLLVDKEGRLSNIVTKRDSLIFFRQRAEEIILLEYIESSLKEHIKRTFTIDSELQDALQKEVNDFVGNRKKTENYLRFLKNAVVDVFVAKGYELDIHDEQLHEIVDSHFPLTKEKTLGDVSFDSLINLIIDSWPKFETRFQRNPDIWKKMLVDVRDIRNKLFHFKGEITEIELKKLHSCASWIEGIPYPETTQQTMYPE